MCRLVVASGSRCRCWPIGPRDEGDAPFALWDTAFVIDTSVRASQRLAVLVVVVVLGCGERLFGETSDKKAMRLVDTQIVDGDVAFLTYERVRDA
jgi:hypothetical protein